jgi:hypothetical protein
MGDAVLTIRPSNDADVLELARELHEDDAAELRAASLSVEQCMAGVACEALCLDGRLVALFGVQGHPAVPGSGIPWMLCTNALRDVSRRAMAEVSRRVVAEWFDEYAHLSNLVYRRHASAVRFVRWLGFKVHATPCGPRQEFYLFEWERPCAIR